MSARTPHSSPADDPLGAARHAIPSCSITEPDLQRQRQRFARLAADVLDSHRADDHVWVEFAPGFDRSILEAMIAVERRCCPFFRFDWDEDSRRLRVGVQDETHAPALAVLTEQLTG